MFGLLTYLAAAFFMLTTNETLGSRSLWPTVVLLVLAGLAGLAGLWRSWQRRRRFGG